MHPRRLLARNRNERQERLWKVLGVGANTNGIISQYVNRVQAAGGTIEGLTCLNNQIKKLLEVPIGNSNAYEAASFVSIPSGYGTGVVYAQKPIDGSADLSVVRGTTRTRVQREGLIEEIAANVAGLDYSYNTILNSCPAFNPQSLRTNAIIYSNDLTQASWSNTAVITSGQSSPTVAGNEGWLVNDNSASQFLVIQQQFSKANNTNTVSVFVKKTSGTPTHYPYMGISYFTGISVPNQTFYLLNTSTGQGSLDFNSALNPSLNAESVGDFWRFAVTSTDITGIESSVRFEFYPSVSTDGVNVVPTATGSQVVYGFQSEIGSVATSYIPTGASSITRNAEVIGNTSSSSVIGASGCIWGKFMANSNAGHIFDISDGTTSNSIQIDYGNAGAGILRATVFTSGVPHTIISTSALSEGIHSFAFKYESGFFALYVDGVLAGTSTNVNMPSGLDELYIGSNIGTSSWFNGHILGTLLIPFSVSLSSAQQLSLA